ncbi:death domain-containing protein 1-like isoform X2 [Antedon mediterranea]
METEKATEEAADVQEVEDIGDVGETTEDSTEDRSAQVGKDKGEEATENEDSAAKNDVAIADGNDAAVDDVAEDVTAAGNDKEAPTEEGTGDVKTDDVTTDNDSKNNVSIQNEDALVNDKENPTPVEQNKEPELSTTDGNVQNKEEQEDSKEEDNAAKREETPRPKSPNLNNNDKPLEWPHFTMHLPSDDEISCFLRCRDGEFSSSSLSCYPDDISGDAIEDSEEVISNCIKLRDSRVGEGGDDYELLSYPIVVAIPYQINARLANTKEIVVKQKVVKEEQLSDDNPEVVKTVYWKVLQPLATDSSIADYKGQFVEVAITRLTSFAVVARMVKDKMTIGKKGGVVKSTADHRVAITYPQGACTLVNLSLQIQPAESVATDLKARFRHCSDLIGASPILHMTHTPNKKFEKPISVAMPCPPNPNKGNTPGNKASKSERKEIPPMVPEGAIIIRKTKKSSYGGDSDDFLHALYKQTENGAWNDLEKVEIKQVRKDVVSLDLKRPVESLLVLRMGVETKYTPKQIATTFEQALQVKYANIILYHKVDSPEKIIVQIVPTRQLENVRRRLNNDDYDGPPEPSPDIPMTEGQEITLRLTGNVKIVDHEELKLTFHTQRTNTVEFTIKERNSFGNYSSSEYRGVAEFYGQSRVLIDEPDDPEEILLRESEAKAAEKKNKSSDFGGAKGQKEQKAKEKIETSVSKMPKDLLCKLAVSIPKSEPDPLMPASCFRTTALDGEGMVSNENLRWLSKELVGRGWEKLATSLGIKRNRMQSIKRRNPSKTEEAQVLDMLITWRCMMPKAYNKEKKLAAALVNCGCYDLSEELKDRKMDMESEGTRDEEE